MTDTPEPEPLPEIQEEVVAIVEQERAAPGTTNFDEILALLRKV